MINLSCDYCGGKITLTETKHRPEDWTWHSWINRNGCDFEYRPRKTDKHICEKCALDRLKAAANKLFEQGSESAESVSED